MPASVNLNIDPGGGGGEWNTPQNSSDRSPPDIKDPSVFGDKSGKYIPFWRNRVQSTSRLKTVRDNAESRKEALRFYAGDQYTNQELVDWDGLTIVCNLFRPQINFLFEAIYSQDPNIRVRPKKRLSSVNKEADLAASIVETHLQFSYDEEMIGAEVRRVGKWAYFGNVAAAKIEFDRDRGLWYGRWCAGEVYVDPDCHGDVRRARWVAERITLPRYEVINNVDGRFDPEVCKLIGDKVDSDSGTYHDESTPGEDRKPNNHINIWYIYTTQGIDPVYGSDPTKKRLLVMADGCNKWLLNEEDPCPWLEHDELPYVFYRIEEIPGEWLGPSYWKALESLCKAYNWAVSYHLHDMRVSSTRLFGYNKNLFEDPSPFNARKSWQPVPMTGNPTGSVAPLDLGGRDKSIFQSVEFLRQQIHNVTGVDAVAMGMQGSREKTATESQILQQNSNIALRGPARALDVFLSDLVRKVALATLYYTPAFSIFKIPGPDGNPVFATRELITKPQLDPMGQPVLDPTGSPVMVSQLTVVPAPGATEEVLGIDSFHGDEAALAWPKAQFHEIKRDTEFLIEAGSTRFQHRLETKQTASELLQTMGPVYQNLGLWPHYYELLRDYAKNFELDDASGIFPTKEEFLQAVQAKMAPPPPPGGPPGAPGAPPTSPPIHGAPNPGQFAQPQQPSGQILPPASNGESR